MTVDKRIIAGGSAVLTGAMVLFGTISTVALGHVVSQPVMLLFTITFLGLVARDRLRTDIKARSAWVIILSVVLAVTDETLVAFHQGQLMLWLMGIVVLAKALSVGGALRGTNTTNGRALTSLTLNTALLIADILWLMLWHEWGLMLALLTVGGLIIVAICKRAINAQAIASAIALVLAEQLLPKLSASNVVLIFAGYCLYVICLVVITRKG